MAMTGGSTRRPSEIPTSEDPVVTSPDKTLAELAAHRFVFVAGLHKSGTSVLYRSLAAHPETSGFGATPAPENEGQHLQTVYPSARSIGGPGRFGFHPLAHLTEASPLVTEENRLRLFTDWARYWDLGRPVLVEKSPPNLVRMRFLQAMFPNSHFIAIIRHPIPVALSTQKWAKVSLLSMIKHWTVCHETFEADKPHVQRLLTIRYEELVAQPAVVLGTIFSFLGLERRRASRGERISDQNQRYFEQWERRKHSVSGKAIAWLIREELGARIRALGYSILALSPLLLN